MVHVYFMGYGTPGEHEAFKAAIAYELHQGQLRTLQLYDFCTKEEELDKVISILESFETPDYFETTGNLAHVKRLMGMFTSIKPFQRKGEKTHHRPQPALRTCILGIKEDARRPDGTEAL